MKFFVFNTVNKIGNKDLGIVQIPDEKISKEEIKQKILSGKSWDKKLSNSNNSNCKNG